MEVENNCPINKFEPCKKLQCAWFIELRGTHPQTGEEISEWGCSMAMIPMLLIENSKQSSQTGAAVESFRNVMVQQQKEILELAQAGEVQTLIR